MYRKINALRLEFAPELFNVEFFYKIDYLTCISSHFTCNLPISPKLYSCLGILKHKKHYEIIEAPFPIVAPPRCTIKNRGICASIREITIHGMRKKM